MAIPGTVGRNAGYTDGLDSGNGVICRGGVQTGFYNASAPAIITSDADIKDGTSKTFLLGEAIPEYCAWSVWYWFDGCTATCGIPLNYRKPHSLPIDNATDWQHSYSFMSRHTGGANFIMCDSSLKFISNTIDQTVYQALATIDGRENVQVP